MAAHWKHTATRCAVEGCERTRRKGWTACGLTSHYRLGVSLYGLRAGEPRLLSEAAATEREAAARAAREGVSA